MPLSEIEAPACRSKSPETFRLRTALRVLALAACVSTPPVSTRTESKLMSCALNCRNVPPLLTLSTPPVLVLTAKARLLPA